MDGRDLSLFSKVAEGSVGERPGPLTVLQEREKELADPQHELADDLAAFEEIMCLGDVR